MSDFTKQQIDAVHCPKVREDMQRPNSQQAATKCKNKYIHHTHTHTRAMNAPVDVLVEEELQRRREHADGRVEKLEVEAVGGRPRCGEADGASRRRV